MLIVCDFDGTVTERDTLDYLAHRFAPHVFAELDGRLLRGEMNLRDVLRHELKAITLSHDEVVAAAVEAVPVRAGFGEFLEFARARGDRVVLLSAGFRQLIEPLLEREGIEGVELVANEVSFSPEGGTVRFREVASCDACDEHCKGSEVDQLRAEHAGDPVVYIGDGYSDRCGAQAADRVFARDGLAEYLGRRGVPFEPFDDFHDVRVALHG